MARAWPGRRGACATKLLDAALTCGVLVALAGCAPSASGRSERSAAPRVELGPLDVDGQTRESLDPRLRERLRATPIAYFRFINVSFGNEVCRRFKDDPVAMRAFNLHDDAHVDQYAITETGRGLTDFDDAAIGPAVLDLVRFGTSIVLTCRHRGWNDDPVLDAFVKSYARALQDPSVRAAEPRIVGRVRSKLRFDPELYFAWLHSLMEPLAPDAVGSISASLQPYVDARLSEEPALGREYFRAIAVGRSRMGIGSARARKYLVRIAGPTASPDDDDVLELKEVGDVSGISCLSRGAVLDPTRLIVAQARIAYEPYRLIGSVLLDGRAFWVHAWPRSYRELSASDFESADELLEVASDVGVQLGLGHPKFIASPFDRELRQSGHGFVTSHERELVAISKAMADEVVAAWRRFRGSTRAGVSH